MRFGEQHLETTFANIDDLTVGFIEKIKRNVVFYNEKPFT